MSTHSPKQNSETSPSKPSEPSHPDELSETESEDSGLCTSFISSLRDGEQFRGRQQALWQTVKPVPSKTGSSDHATSGHVVQERPSSDGMIEFAAEAMDDDAQGDNLVPGETSGWASADGGLKRYHSCQVLDTIPSPGWGQGSGLVRRSTESNLGNLGDGLRRSLSLSMSELRLVRRDLPVFCEAAEGEPGAENDAGKFTTVHYKSPEIGFRSSRHRRSGSRDNALGKRSWKSLPQVQGQSTESQGGRTAATGKTSRSHEAEEQLRVGDAYAAESQAMKLEQEPTNQVTKLSHVVGDSAQAGNEVSVETAAFGQRDQGPTVSFKFAAPPQTMISSKPSAYRDAELIAIDVISPQANTTPGNTSAIVGAHLTPGGGRILKELREISIQPLYRRRNQNETSTLAELDETAQRLSFLDRTISADIDIVPRKTGIDDEPLSGTEEENENILRRESVEEQNESKVFDFIPDSKVTAEQTDSIPYSNETTKSNESILLSTDTAEQNDSILDSKETTEPNDSIPDSNKISKPSDSISDSKGIREPNDYNIIPDSKGTAEPNDSIPDSKETSEPNDANSLSRQTAGQNYSILDFKETLEQDFLIPALKKTSEQSEPTSDCKESARQNNSITDSEVTTEQDVPIASKTTAIKKELIPDYKMITEQDFDGEAENSFSVSDSKDAAVQNGPILEDKNTSGHDDCFRNLKESLERREEAAVEFSEKDLEPKQRHTKEEPSLFANGESKPDKKDPTGETSRITEEDSSRDQKHQKKESTGFTGEDFKPDQQDPTKLAAGFAEGYFTLEQGYSKNELAIGFTEGDSEPEHKCPKDETTGLTERIFESEQKRLKREQIGITQGDFESEHRYPMREAIRFAEEDLEPRRKLPNWSGKKLSLSADSADVNLLKYDPNESTPSTAVTSLNATSSRSRPKPLDDEAADVAGKTTTASNQVKDASAQTSKSLEDLFVASRQITNATERQGLVAGRSLAPTPDTQNDETPTIRQYLGRDSDEDCNDPKSLIRTALLFVRKSLEPSSDAVTLSPPDNEVEHYSTVDGFVDEPTHQKPEIQKFLKDDEHIACAAQMLVHDSLNESETKYGFVYTNSMELSAELPTDPDVESISNDTISETHSKSKDVEDNASQTIEHNASPFDEDCAEEKVMPSWTASEAQGDVAQGQVFQSSSDAEAKEKTMSRSSQSQAPDEADEEKVMPSFLDTNAPGVVAEESIVSSSSKREAQDEIVDRTVMESSLDTQAPCDVLEDKVKPSSSKMETQDEFAKDGVKLSSLAVETPFAVVEEKVVPSFSAMEPSGVSFEEKAMLSSSTARSPMVVVDTIVTPSLSERVAPGVVVEETAMPTSCKMNAPEVVMGSKIVPSSSERKTSRAAVIKKNVLPSSLAAELPGEAVDEGVAPTSLSPEALSVNVNAPSSFATEVTGDIAESITKETSGFVVKEIIVSPSLETEVSGLAVKGAAVPSSSATADSDIVVKENVLPSSLQPETLSVDVNAPSAFAVEVTGEIVKEKDVQSFQTNEVQGIVVEKIIVPSTKASGVVVKEIALPLSSAKADPGFDVKDKVVTSSLVTEVPKKIVKAKDELLAIAEETQGVVLKEKVVPSPFVAGDRGAVGGVKAIPTSSATKIPGEALDEKLMPSSSAQDVPGTVIKEMAFPSSSANGVPGDVFERKVMSSSPETEAPDEDCSNSVESTEPSTSVNKSENESNPVHVERQRSNALDLDKEILKQSDDPIEQLMSVNAGCISQIEGELTESWATDKRSQEHSGDSSDKVGPVDLTHAFPGYTEQIAESPPRAEVPEQVQRVSESSKATGVPTQEPDDSTEGPSRVVTLSAEYPVKTSDGVSPSSDELNMSNNPSHQHNLCHDEGRIEQTKADISDDHSVQERFVIDEISLGSDVESAHCEADNKTALGIPEIFDTSQSRPLQEKATTIDQSNPTIKVGDTLPVNTASSVPENVGTLQRESSNEILRKLDADDGQYSSLAESADHPSRTLSSPALDVPSSGLQDYTDSNESFLESEENLALPAKSFSEVKTTNLEVKEDAPVNHSHFDLSESHGVQEFENSDDSLQAKNLSNSGFLEITEHPEVAVIADLIMAKWDSAEESLRNRDREVETTSSESQEYTAGSHPDIRLCPSNLAEVKDAGLLQSVDQTPVHNALNSERIEDNRITPNGDDVVDDVISEEGYVVEDVIVESDVDNDVMSTGQFVIDGDVALMEADDGDDVGLEADVISRMHQTGDSSICDASFEDFVTDSDVVRNFYSAEARHFAAAVQDDDRGGGYLGDYRCNDTGGLLEEFSRSNRVAVAEADFKDEICSSDLWHHEPSHRDIRTVSSEVEFDAGTSRATGCRSESRLSPETADAVEPGASSLLDPLLEERRRVYSSLLRLQYLSQEWMELIEDQLDNDVQDTDLQLLELVENQPSGSLLDGFGEGTSHPAVGYSTTGASDLGQTTSRTDNRDYHNSTPWMMLSDPHQPQGSYRSPDVDSEYYQVLFDAYHPESKIRDRYQSSVTAADAYQSNERMGGVYQPYPPTEESYNRPETAWSPQSFIADARHSQLLPLGSFRRQKASRDSEPPARKYGKSDEYRPKFSNVTRRHLRLNRNPGLEGSNWSGTRTDIRGVTHGSTDWSRRCTEMELARCESESVRVSGRSSYGFTRSCSLCTKRTIGNKARHVNHDLERNNPAGSSSLPRRCELCLRDYREIFEASMKDRTADHRSRWRQLKPAYLRKSPVQMDRENL